jgi:hypothetical protein
MLSEVISKRLQSKYNSRLVCKNKLNLLLMVIFAFFIKDSEEAYPSYVTRLNKSCIIFP